jgi:hypothetical protein
MERTYHALWYRLDSTDAFLLWYSNDQDGVIIEEAGRLLSFADLNVLQQWADAQGIAINTEERQLHDLDMVQEWCEHPTKDTIDCVAFLDAWNLFVDVRASNERRNVVRDDPENNHLSDKVFFGNNLSAITPPGEHYVPQWSDKEAKRLRHILTEGLHLLCERRYSVKGGAEK